MYRTLVTLLLGMMLLAGGSASALTFKSDGSVVQSDGTIVRSATSIKNNNKFASWSDYEVCSAAVKEQGKLFGSKPYSNEAKRRQTNCDVVLMGNTSLCHLATSSGTWETREYYQPHVSEAKRRGLTCGVGREGYDVAVNGAETSEGSMEATLARLYDDSYLCSIATNTNIGGLRVWQTSTGTIEYRKEAKRRGLTCGVHKNETLQTRAGGSTQSATAGNVNRFPHLADSGLCNFATRQGRWEKQSKYLPYVKEAKHRGLTCGVGESGSSRTVSSGVSYDNQNLAERLSDMNVCRFATRSGTWDTRPEYSLFVVQAKRRGLNCGVDGSGSVQTAAAPKRSVSSAELTAAQQKAEEERLKRLELEQELAALKAEKEQQQATISADSQIPLIEVASQQKDEATALVFGRAKDNVGVADVLVNNEPVQIGSDGSFQTQLYIPPNGVVVEITAYDLKGNKATKTLSLNRSEAKDAAETRFAQLQPSLGKRGAINRNAIALIVGVEKYENLPAAPAIHADKDAEYFADFAHYKLGVPRNNIIKAINSDARRLDILKALAKVTQLSKENETEVFIFFARHGLAADDGKDVFLIPYDGDTGSFLAETAITRSEIFQKVERIGPKSVTVFLDACYTGGTRSQDVTLVASKRPVQVKALNQSVPQGFTILSASASDETSMALEAAEHGMFSYFLMKGMGGDADANNDNQITMAEMRDYVKDKVVRQSNFQQTPELQGDADRVFVRFQ